MNEAPHLTVKKRFLTMFCVEISPLVTFLEEYLECHCKSLDVNVTVCEGYLEKSQFNLFVKKLYLVLSEMERKFSYFPQPPLSLHAVVQNGFCFASLIKYCAFI